MRGYNQMSGYLGDSDFSLGADNFGQQGAGYPQIAGYLGADPQQGQAGPRLVARMQPLPMDELTLAASASGNASCEPQRGFAPAKFFVASSIGQYLKITDIKVGQG